MKTSKAFFCFMEPCYAQEDDRWDEKGTIYLCLPWERKTMSLRRIKTFPLLFIFLPFPLCSCSKSPITFFNSFSRYVSEDGVMILECQLNKKSGFGKLKIDNKYEMFKWGSDLNGYGLWARVGEKFFLSFSI